MPLHTNDELIQQTANWVKKELQRAEAGHDWWHVYRVWKMAQTIQSEEGGSEIVVNIAALLHDIADAKFHDGDESLAVKKSAEWMHKLRLPLNIIEHVLFIISNMSYRTSLQNVVEHTPEFNIVQDADRLDAMGAIGIARAFSYGGYKQRPFYDPALPPASFSDKDSYTKSTAPTINHFYEKLLLLKDKMNTATGKRLAEGRHEYMNKFLQQFYGEWEGEV